MMKDDSEQGAWEALLSAQSHTRIVACVNGCKSINPDAIPVMLEALELCHKELTSFLRFEAEAPGHHVFLIEAAAETARAAIAKAKK